MPPRRPSRRAGTTPVARTSRQAAKAHAAKPLRAGPPWSRRVLKALRWMLAVVLGSGAALVVAINLLVAFCGDTSFPPWNPFFLPQRVHALKLYARHRSACIFRTAHEDILDVTHAAALRHGVDPLLLESLVEIESGTRAHRMSPVGAMGPAQLMPTTAELLHVEDPFDPVQGIDGGARYLAMMLKRFDGQEPLALAAYNAGPGNVVGGRIPINGETEFYVQRILDRVKVLRTARQRAARPAR